MANLQFWRSNQMSDTSFLDLVKRTFGKTFTKGIDAKNWLITNGNMDSDDVAGGMEGVQQDTTAKYSAGDVIGCCQNTTGINRSARVEVYVR